MGVILNELGKYQQSDTAIQPFIPAANLLRETMIQVAHGYSTVHAEMDFETYSEAGHVFNEEEGRFRGLGANKKGLSAVGAAVYAMHASTEVLCLAYNLKDGLGPRLWMMGDPPPWDLFAYIQSGGLIEAHNSIFEYFIWTYVCVAKMGWPALDYKQLRCSMSKAAAFALPMSLDKLTAALDAPIKKDKEGAAVMLKLVQPRTPTKTNPSLRLTRQSSPLEFKRLGQYCVNDTYAESEVSAMLPDLQPDELELWLLDQQINIRGVHIDKASLDNCISIVEQAFDKYSEELKQLCGGYHDAQGAWQWNVSSPAELANIRVYLAAKGVQTPSLDAEHLAALLARDNLPPECRRVLEIRDMLSASSVKKLFSLLNHLGPDDRVRGLFAFCGADRTGRFAGRGPQPQNMPSSGPKLNLCDKINGCGHYFQNKLTHCPWCRADAAFSKPKQDWSHHAVDQALKVIASRRLDYVEYYYGDAIAVISGCLRGLFSAAPGKDFICSDFSAIEAVVLAELAGETWRQEVFRTHGKIYEMGAAKITGIPFEEFMAVAGYTDLTKEKWWEEEQTGSHHPQRKTIGKVSELACLAGGTEVLTQNGYVQISNILPSDKIWDGTGEWIKHGGVVAKGEKKVINFDGVWMTPDHKILTCGEYTDDGYRYQWKEAGDFISTENTNEAYTAGGNYLPDNAFCRKTKVYDLLYCGPEHRFTIRTDAGHLLVHNSGYAGWIGAWKNFGADKFMTDEEIKKAILVWRDASPMIVELWGGQWRKNPKKWEFTPEMYGLEGAAIQAVMNPGQAYSYRMLSYQVHDDVLYCRLPSGRLLSYHEPRLVQGSAPHGNPVWQLTYMGSDEVGRWVRLNTYGGKFCENCIAFGTLVATGRGWVPIQDVKKTDFIFDGREWVKHDGLVYKGKKPCILVGNVAMTKDHLVWTEDGWKAAEFVGPKFDVIYLPLIDIKNTAKVRPVSTKRQKVYDLINCGPRNRFVVKGDQGPFIVHNCTQAVARDILTYSMRNLEKAGYHIVLHIHDEIVCEVDKGFGSIEEFERIMAIMPPWAADWPIRAAGGWRGLRYRKG